jgi:hypothetical protein
MRTRRAISRAVSHNSGTAALERASHRSANRFVIPRRTITATPISQIASVRSAPRGKANIAAPALDIAGAGAAC